MRSEIVEIDNNPIQSIQLDGQIYVVVKPPVASLGLAWNGQFERLKRHPVLSEGIRIIRMPSEGGMQETTVLELERFHGFLATINPLNIKDQTKRALVIEYQRRAFRAIYEAFHGPMDAMSKTPRPFPNASERVTLQREVNRLMERLRRARNREERRVIYDMLKQTTAALSIEAPPIEALGFDAPESDDVTRPFWNAITALTARGVNCNLSLKPDQTLAINIKWLEQQCQEHGIAFRASPTIKAALRETTHPRFVDADTCRTSLGKLMHCYVFSVGAPLLLN